MLEKTHMDHLSAVLSVSEIELSGLKLNEEEHQWCLTVRYLAVVMGGVPYHLLAILTQKQTTGYSLGCYHIAQG